MSYTDRRKLEEDFKNYLIEIRELLDNTIDNYMFTIGKFFDHAGLPPYKTPAVVGYVSHLKKQGYTQGYQRNHINLVKVLYDFLGEDCPLRSSVRKGKRNLVPVEAKAKPTFTLEEVEQMIDARKMLDSRQQSFLALSTTYGFRRGEIGSFNADVFDWDISSFKILILKSREIKSHLVPAEIIPTLINYGFPAPLSVGSMSRIFKQICRRTGVQVRKGFAWHAIRRRLAIEFDECCVQKQEMTYRELQQFMNWKTVIRTRRHEQASAMVMRYTEREALSLDKKVFGIHPFLRLWIE